MKLQIFCVYDVKAEAYMQPFFMTQKGEAIRAFTDQCNNPDTMFYKHPLDFTLIHLGEFEDSNGRIESLNAATPLGTANEFKRIQPTKE